MTKPPDESAELRYRLDLEEVVTEILTGFISRRAEEVDPEIERALGDIGRFAGCDRTFIFTFLAGQTQMDCTHEWCAAGIEPRAPRLQAAAVADYPTVVREILSGRTVRIPDLAAVALEPGPEADELAGRGCRSLLLVPMICGGAILGFLGLESASRSVAWPREVVGLIRKAGEAFAHSLRRKRDDEAQIQAHRRLRDIIESLPDPTFVIDAEKKVIAWNHAIETLTGVPKEEILGRGDYAYAVPFYGTPKPVLVDLLDMPPSESEGQYGTVTRSNGNIYAESFLPGICGGRGAHLWGVASPLFDRDGRRWGAIESIRDVTDRIRVEERLRASEERYRFFVERSFEGIWLVDFPEPIPTDLPPEEQVRQIHETGRIAECNDALARMYGFASREELRGMRLLTLYGGKVRDHIAGRTLELVRAGYLRNDLETAEVDRHGRRIHFLNNAVGEIKDGKLTGLWGTKRDVTELKRMEEDLRRLNTDLERRVSDRTRELEKEVQERTAAEESLRIGEQKYRELVENANSIILRLDTQGRITFFNEFAQRFFGFREEEILGRCAVGTIVPDVETGGRDLRRMIADLGEHPERFASNENENVRKGGERVWISWTNKPIFDPAGRLLGCLCVGNDITGLIQMERDLLRAKEAAEAADRIKSAFLATMSHELRTPLNSIIGFTGILLQGLPGPLNAEQQKQMGMIQHSSRHLLDLINDVLDISKIESGQLEVTSKPFDLRASILKTVQIVRPLADRKGLPVTVEIHPSVGVFPGDARRVEQIVLNLLNNAVKFTEVGRVHVGARPEGGGVSIAVMDTGIGIRPEDQGKIFHPFTQIDDGLTRKHEGTGLGLSISRRLAEIMGGTISLVSRPGEGSTFTVTLPAPAEGRP